MVIDPESTPLLAQMTANGHHIGAPDDANFEYGLDCILDHARRLIETAVEVDWPATQTGEVERHPWPDQTQHVDGLRTVTATRAPVR